jgi:hypothetical protein
MAATERASKEGAEEKADDERYRRGAKMGEESRLQGRTLLLFAHQDRVEREGEAGHCGR